MTPIPQPRDHASTQPMTMHTRTIVPVADPTPQGTSDGAPQRYLELCESDEDGPEATPRTTA